MMSNSIKQELSNEQYWTGTSSQTWNNSEINYPSASIPDSTTNNRIVPSNQFFQAMDNARDPKESNKNVAHFYSTGQSTFQQETMSSNFLQSKASPSVPHPSLSSPCLAASPPSTPLKHCYNNNNSYTSKFFRRAITPSYVTGSQNGFLATKCQQNLHQQQGRQQSRNLQRTTSAVFPQGPPQSPFSTNKFTPASAATSNFFQFPPSYDDVQVLSPNMKPPTPQNPNQFIYTHQFPSTSPFLAAQSRPRTPFTPNASCRQHQFYYNHGEESPLTPSMRNYHKTPTYHPYLPTYRYYSQHKHHSSIQSFQNFDSEVDQCLEMLEKGNINNLSASSIGAGNMMSSNGVPTPFGANVKQPNNLMEFTPGDDLTNDLDCLVGDNTRFCSTMDGNSTSEWSGIMNSSGSSLGTQNYCQLSEPTIKVEMQVNMVYNNSAFNSRDVASCEQFHPPPTKVANDQSSNHFTARGSSNIHTPQFPSNAFDFSMNLSQMQQQESFISGPVSSEVTGHRVDPMPGESPVQNNEKRKKKHKPEPLWIPANVSNFANTGGCFIDHSNNCDRPMDGKHPQKPPPPPYARVTPSGSVSCHTNKPLLPNTAPALHNFSLNLNDSVTSCCEFEIGSFSEF